MKWKTNITEQLQSPNLVLWIERKIGHCFGPHTHYNDVIRWYDEIYDYTFEYLF